MEAPEYFKQHEEDDTRRFGEIYSDTQEIKSDIKKIRDNHLAHIEPDVAAIKTNIEWLKWLLGAILLGMLGIFWSSLK